jgi:hypothetical protein
MDTVDMEVTEDTAVTAGMDTTVGPHTTEDHLTGGDRIGLDLPVATTPGTMATIPITITPVQATARILAARRQDFAIARRHHTEVSLATANRFHQARSRVNIIHHQVLHHRHLLPTTETGRHLHLLTMETAHHLHLIMAMGPHRHPIMEMHLHLHLHTTEISLPHRQATATAMDRTAHTDPAPGLTAPTPVMPAAVSSSSAASFSSS